MVVRMVSWNPEGEEAKSTNPMHTAGKCKTAGGYSNQTNREHRAAAAVQELVLVPQRQLVPTATATLGDLKLK